MKPALSPSLLDLIRLGLEAAWRRRYLLVVPIVVMIPLSILAARMSPKVYEAKTILLLQETSKENKILTDYAIGLNVKDRMAALTSLLGSEHVLLSVLRELGEIGPQDDPAKITSKVRELASGIAVKLAGNDLLEFTLKSRTREGLGRKLSAITKHFLSQLLSPEQSRVKATQNFLKEQMEKRRVELNAAEAEVAAFHRVNAELLPDIHEKNVRRLQSIEEELATRNIELAGARGQFQVMRDQLGSANPIIGKLEESIMQVTGELTTLRARYADGHSEVKAAERRLARLRDERQGLIDAVRNVSDEDIETLWRLATSTAAPESNKQVPLLVSQLLRLQDAKTKIATLEQQMEKLKAISADLRVYIVAYTPIEQQRKDLEATVTKLRLVYETLQARFETASTSLALGIFEAPERVKVIDAAADPTVPSSLPGFVFIVGGIFAGIALGGGLAVMAELLDQRLRHSAQFSAVAHLPVAVRLPRLGESGATLSPGALQTV